MTKKRQSQLNTQKGFTLVELIVVLVIMVILLSLGIGGILAWQDWSKFKKENTAAETIFYALQNQFTEYDASGVFDDKITDEIALDAYLIAEKDPLSPKYKKYFDNSSITYEENKYYKWEPDSNDGIALWANTPTTTGIDKSIYQGDIYCIYAKKDDYDRYLAKDATLDKGTKLLFDCVTPYISDTSVLNGAIWAEFSPQARQVFSVGYSDKVTEFSYDASSSQMSMLDRTEDTRRKHQIGYYCAESLSIPIKGKDKIKLGDLTLVNGGVLELIIKEDPGKITSTSHYIVSLYSSKEKFESTKTDANEVNEENKAHIDIDELLASMDFTVSGSYDIHTLAAAAANPQSIQCSFFEGAFTDEKKTLRVPVYTNDSHTEIHIVLDAADIQAQSFMCADRDNPETEFLNTYSFYRLGLPSSLTEHIGCSISPDGDEDNSKYSNSDCATFAEVSTSSSPKVYDIENGRHLYNVRFETDFKELNNTAAQREFVVKKDIDWAVFTNKAKEAGKENYYLTSYSPTHSVVSGIDYDGLDSIINKADVPSSSNQYDTSNYAFPGFRTLGLNDTFRGETIGSRHATISNLTISFAANMRCGVYGKDAYLEWKNNADKLKDYGKYDGINTRVIKYDNNKKVDWDLVQRFDCNTYSEIHPTHANVQKGLYPLGLFGENLGTITNLDLNSHKVLGMEAIPINGQKVVIYTNMVGGFAGNNLGDLSNLKLRSIDTSSHSLDDADSYANESKNGTHINGKTDVGGILGRESWNANGKTSITLQNLENYGQVTGMENVGGIVGRAYLIRDFNQDITSLNNAHVYYGRRLLYDDGYDIYGEFSEDGKLRAGTQKSITGKDVIRVEELTIKDCISHGEVRGDDIIYDVQNYGTANETIIYLYENDFGPISNGGKSSPIITYCMDMSNYRHACTNIGGIAGITMDGIYYDAKNYDPDNQVSWGRNVDINKSKLNVVNCNAYRIYNNSELSQLNLDGTGKMKNGSLKNMIQHDFYKGALIGYCKYTKVTDCTTNVSSSDNTSGKPYVFGRNYVGGLFGCFDFSWVGDQPKNGKAYNIVNTNNVIGVMYVGGFAGGCGIGCCKMENISYRHPSMNAGSQPSQVHGGESKGTIKYVENTAVVLGIKRDALDNGDNGIIKKQDVAIYRQDYSTGTSAWQDMYTDEYDGGIGGIAGVSRLQFDHADNIQSAVTKNYALQLLNGGALNYDNITIEECDVIRTKTIYGGNGVGGIVGISIGYGIANNSKVDAVVYGNDVVGGLFGGGTNISGTQGKTTSKNTAENSLVIGRNMVGGCIGINTFDGTNAKADNTKVIGQYAVGGMVGIITEGTKLEGDVNNSKVYAKAFAGGFCGLIGKEPNVSRASISNVEINSKYFSGGFAGAVYTSEEIKLNNIKVEKIQDTRIESTMFAGGLIGFYNSRQNTKSIRGRKNIDDNLVGLINRFEHENKTGDELYPYVLGVLTGNEVALSNSAVANITFEKSTVKLEDTCNANANIGAGGVFGYLPKGLQATIDLNPSKVQNETLITTGNAIAPLEGESTSFSYSGGVCGRIPEKTTIINAVFKGKIMSASSENYGQIAEINLGTIDACSYTTDIGTGAKNVGGICGINKGTVKNIDVSNVSVSAANAVNIGGIAGINRGTITACKNHMNIPGGKNAGGIAGSSANSTFESCSNFAEITGTDAAGGIMGAVENGADTLTFKDCVNTGKATATANAGIAATVAGTATFELCRNYGEADYALTATDVSTLTAYTITKCLEAGGKGGDRIANNATSDKLVRSFYLIGTSDKVPDGDPSIYDETQDTSEWAVNLKRIADGSIVFERGNVYYTTGINTGVDITAASYDRNALYADIDAGFKSMADKETDYPNNDTTDKKGFVKTPASP